MIRGIPCMKVPLFEIWDGDHHYKIWDNGTVEGFGAHGKVKFINRADDLIWEVRMSMKEHYESLTKINASDNDSPLL